MGLLNLLSGDVPSRVDEASEHVECMLADGHEMFAAATAHTLDNEILDVDLHVLDGDINRREQDLRRAVRDHLTANPRREMVLSLKLLSIVHEAERIGDLAKSIAKAGGLAERPRLGPPVEPLREMRDVILQMFDLARQGLGDEDVEAARRLMQTHEQVKDDTTAYLNTLAHRSDITANEGIVYALTARLLSRVSSHLSNIASAVAAPFEQIRRAPSWHDA